MRVAMLRSPLLIPLVVLFVAGVALVVVLLGRDARVDRLPIGAINLLAEDMQRLQATQMCSSAVGDGAVMTDSIYVPRSKREIPPADKFPPKDLIRSDFLPLVARLDSLEARVERLESGAWKPVKSPLPSLRFSVEPLRPFVKENPK